MPNVDKAIDIAVRYGSVDGDHHKAWVIDQMVRALTDCPVVEKSENDVNGNPYTFEAQGESDAYKQLVAETCNGVDGPETYTWDCGVAP